MSAALHAVLIGLMLMAGLATTRNETRMPIIELVAGAGDNYMATEAPALGTPGGVKLNMPKMPAPTPEPPRPQPPQQEAAPLIEPAPVIPAPIIPAPKKETKAPPAKVVDKAPDAVTKKLKQDMRTLETNMRRNAKKEREAEAKKLKEAEAKRAAEEQKKMTKEEFDRLNKTKTSTSTTPVKTASAKVPKIDAEGIAKGVVGGSTKNTKGGAGGTALTANPDNVLEAYFSLFKIRLREKFVAPPSTSDSNRVAISFRNEADGRITNIRVVKSSGNREFDEAVITAMRLVRMPARPDNKAEDVGFEFSAREKDDR